MYKYNLSIVVPCHNEEKNISALIKRFSQVIAHQKIELVLVDDGSKDNTLNALRHESKKFKLHNAVILTKPQGGYGDAIMFGLKKANGEFLAWTHADLQTDPSDVLKAFRLIKSQLHPEKVFVKGNRVNRASLFDLLFTRTFEIIASLIFGTWLHEINAQPKMFHRFFLAKLTKPPKNFALDLYAYVMAKRNNIDIIAIPVDFGKRLRGESKWGVTLRSKLKTGLNMFSYILKLRSEPR